MFIEHPVTLLASEDGEIIVSEDSVKGTREAAHNMSPNDRFFMYLE